MKCKLILSKYRYLSYFQPDEYVVRNREFELAKEIYTANQSKIMDSVIEMLKECDGDNVVSGTTLTIPVGHLLNCGSAKSFTFNVDGFDYEIMTLSLKEVKHKKNHPNI